MQTIHHRARQRLLELREQHLKQTELMLGVLTEILEVSTESPDDKTLGASVQELLQHMCGANQLLESCQEIKAYNSDNHLPLVSIFLVVIASHYWSWCARWIWPRLLKKKP